MQNVSSSKMMASSCADWHDCSNPSVHSVLQSVLFSLVTVAANIGAVRK